jgi:LacI family transcriptional regulator
VVPDPLSGKATIEDVARACGLSRATVSRVINGEARVKPGTADKVKKAIADLDYHPNLHARALSGGGGNTVGIMLPGIWRSYHSVLLEGIEEVASQEGYDILVRTKNYLEHAERLFDEGRVEGFLFRNIDRPEEHMRLFSRLARRGVPFALIGDALGDFPAIVLDNVGGGRMMALHFAEHGFRRVAFLSGPPDHADSIDRYLGFRMGFEEGGKSPEGIVRIDGDYSTRSGYDSMARAWAEPRPDAVFAANDRMALGALLFCQEKGLRVPEDVAIAGFDDSFFSEYLSPPLTTVRPPVRVMGTTAMRTLISLLREPAAKVGRIILPTTLVLRASCGCAFSRGSASAFLQDDFNGE